MYNYASISKTHITYINLDLGGRNMFIVYKLFANTSAQECPRGLHKISKDFAYIIYHVL